jgi:hypothetical protein
MEGHHLLEEVEPVVSIGSVREISKGRCTAVMVSTAGLNPLRNLRPGDDGNESYADDNGALDFVGHEISGDEAAKEYADPHLMSSAKSHIVQ